MATQAMFCGYLAVRHYVSPILPVRRTALQPFHPELRLAQGIAAPTKESDRVAFIGLATRSVLETVAICDCVQPEHKVKQGITALE
jgi:hypothetical protein